MLNWPLRCRYSADAPARFFSCGSVISKTAVFPLLAPLPILNVIWFEHQCTQEKKKIIIIIQKKNTFQSAATLSAAELTQIKYNNNNNNPKKKKKKKDNNKGRLDALTKKERRERERDEEVSR